MILNIISGTIGALASLYFLYRLVSQRKDGAIIILRNTVLLLYLLTLSCLDFCGVKTLVVIELTVATAMILFYMWTVARTGKWW